MKNQVLFREGIFVSKDSTVFLKGAQCKSCKHLYFPQVASCINCFCGDFDEIVLSRKGKLYTYTVSHMPVHYFDPPHAMGYIELPEGIRIFAPLTEWEEKQLEVGMEMELVVGKLWENNENEIVGYKFKPV